MICIAKRIICIIQVVHPWIQIVEVSKEYLERVTARIKFDPKRKTWIRVVCRVFCKRLIVINHQGGDRS